MPSQYTLHLKGGLIDPCRWEIQKNGRFLDYAGFKWTARYLIRRDIRNDHKPVTLIYDEGNDDNG